MANEIPITPNTTFNSLKEVFFVGALFAELGDMVAGFGSEADNASEFSDEHLTAISYVSEMLTKTGAQFMELAGGEPDDNG